ncbi:MAG: hypothetical protein QOG42_2658 [Solirubrobacteraceae bacterium]|jgi:hypothetical protein|nr:hypothetical protein [Solirubrobacteraceae bacterium]
MNRPLLKALSLASAIAGCLGVLACPALAGSYVVTACSPTNAPGLWTETNTFPTALSTGNNCGGPAIGPLDGSHAGALYAEDVLNSPANIPDGSHAGWTFTAPAGTTITAISYYRSLSAYNDQDIPSGLYTADGSALEECRIPWPFVPPASIHCDKPNNQVPVTFSGLNTSSLFLGVKCQIVTGALACNGGGAPLHAAKADVYSARVTLSESVAPTLTNVAGAAWGGGTVTGVVRVTFAASDASGIQQQIVRSETGQTVTSATNPCDFTLAQPCPQQPSGALSIDTRRVADGPHSFSLIVSDSAGNTQISTSPVVQVRNAAATTPPPPPPAPGSTTTTKPLKTKITAVIKKGKLRVSGSITRSGRVRVSWRSKTRTNRTLAHGWRVTTIRKHKLSVTFALGRRARSGTTRVAIRSGRRIVAQARARRG